MIISVTDPIGRALDRTKLILFNPFSFGKWFVIGFGAWLAQLGEGGFGFNYTGGSSSPGPATGPSFGSLVTDAINWIHDHLAVVIVLTLLAVCIGFVIYVLLLWLNSRGKFIFLDNLALNRAAIAEPWNKYATLGNNLMWFRMGFQLIAFNLFLAIGILGFLLMLHDLRAAWPDLDAFQIGTGTILAIVIVGVLSLALTAVWWFCGMCINDFVVPLMYVRGTKAWPACKEFMATMMRGNFWRFVLYGLLKLAMAMGSGIALAMLGCATCCIGLILMAIPYIGTVATLPVPLFFRCYALHFFEQFGENFRIFKDVPRGGFEVILEAPPTPLP